jgi:hypothetical protein
MVLAKVTATAIKIMTGELAPAVCLSSLESLGRLPGNLASSSW